MRVNPECEHIVGDMRKLSLGRLFDVVFVHDSIGYMTTPEDLKAVFSTAFAHCRPGGIAIFVPDFVRETFQTATSHGGIDADQRGLRYLEWVYDPDESDCTYEMAFAYMLREGSGRPKVKHEAHVLGLFSTADWIDWLSRAGFEPETVMDPFSREVFVGRRAKP
jgi:hypothetical protein